MEEKKKDEAYLNEEVGTAAATHHDTGETFTHDGKPPVTHAQQMEDFGLDAAGVQERQDERNAEAADSLAGGKDVIANDRTGVEEDTKGGLANQAARNQPAEEPAKKAKPKAKKPAANKPAKKPAAPAKASAKKGKK